MPVTTEQLEAYLRFDGDRDGLARSALPREQIRRLDAAWPVLDALRLELGNLKRGHLSATASARVERQARQVLPGEEGFRRFLEFA